MSLYVIGWILHVQVNNNCSTGSTALIMAKQLIEGGYICELINCDWRCITVDGLGMANCMMALGFEKMARDSMSKQQVVLVS